LRGTREAIVLDWGGTKHPMLPGSQVPGYTTGATASLGGDQPIAAEIQFSIPLDFNGSEVSRRVSLSRTIATSRWVRCEMEDFVLRTRLSAIVDKPNWQRAIYDASRF
jgi:hypothetical protein